MLELVRPSADRLRVACRDEHRAEHDQRERADGNATDFNEPIQPAVRSVHPRIEEQDKRREQHDAGHGIEQPLDDDGGEGRRRAQPFLPGEQVGANHLARARGEHGTRRKADRGGAKGRPKPRVANWFEQVLPPQRPQHHRQHGDGRRQPNQPRVGVLDLRPDDIQMGAAKEEREQPNREEDDDSGPEGFLH